MKISILTATYNREKLLPRLYKSIKENSKTYSDIEWIIMDDGSIDKTKEKVKHWIDESKFEIKYYYQKNQGKMMAINNAMKYVTGDIIIEMDSDDYFVNNVFNIINNDYENLENKNVYGILYKKELIGKTVDSFLNLNNKIIKLFDLHYRYNYDFDMALTFKTELRKKYKYELEKNEKFITEAQMYYKMDFTYEGLLIKDYKIMVCEYQMDGYTSKIKNMFKKYPQGYYKFFKETLNYKRKKILFKRRLYLVKHYILFSYLTNKTIIQTIKNINGINKLLIILLVIPGFIKAKKF